LAHSIPPSAPAWSRQVNDNGVALTTPMEDHMFKSLLAAGAAAALLVSFANASQAQTLLMQDNESITQAQDAQNDNDRLVIVNGNTHHVIYDDGRNDLFCVTRVVVAGYTYYGRPIYRRTMSCR
jgi:hypothetical protein